MRSKQISSYPGLFPQVCSLCGKQRLGLISKQEKRLLQTLSRKRHSRSYALTPSFPESINTAATRSTGHRTGVRIEES